MSEYICKEMPEGFGCSVRTGYKKVKELVRCKDCKYRSTGVPYLCLYGRRKENDPEDWFCAYGERR